MPFASDFYPRDIARETAAVICEEMPHIDPDTIGEFVRANPRMETDELMTALQSQWDEWAEAQDA